MASFYTRRIPVFLLRIAARTLLVERKAAGAKPPRNASPASQPTSRPFETLFQAVSQGAILHGSPKRLMTIEPRGRAGLVFATDDVLLAAIVALAHYQYLQHPIYRFGLYRFQSGADYWFLSLHEALENIVDIDRIMYVHICAPGHFQPLSQGFFHRNTCGKVHDFTQWATDTRVVPEAVVEIRLRDFPLPVALHKEGTTTPQARFRYRRARKANWSIQM